MVAKSYSRILVVGVIAAGIGLTSVACSPEGKQQSESDKNLQTLAVLYGRFVSQHRGVGPPSEAEFKKFIRALPKETLDSFGLDSAGVDKIFVSPRDNEPYGIAWKASGGAPTQSGGPMIIWEHKGVGGKRFVADSLGKIEEIDEATFNQRLATVKQPK